MLSAYRLQIPQVALKDLMAQLCDVLVYLEGMLVVHRDVQPETVLCERAEDGAVRAVLADFGHAARIGDAAWPSFRAAGTPGFIAPEVFRDDFSAEQSDSTAEGAANFSKIDVFSFGLLMATVLTGRNPFQGETAEETIKKNAELEYSPRVHFREVNIITESLRVLLSAICARDPRQRPSATEAAAHPWFSVGRTRTTPNILHALCKG